MRAWHVQCQNNRPQNGLEMNQSSWAAIPWADHRGPAISKGQMARKPLGPLAIIPQFEDMGRTRGATIKPPPEDFVSEILDDPIFHALGSMWNRIETSQELAVKHQENQVAFMQGRRTSACRSM